MYRFLFTLACALVGASAFAQNTNTLPADTVVVSRGNTHLTFKDIDQYLEARVPADKRAATMDSSKRIEAMLLNILLNTQLAQQAELMHLDQDPEAFGKTGWERIEVLSRLRMQEFIKEIKVPDFEQLAREEYAGHKDRYAVRGPVELQRIFLASGDLTAEDAWKRAASVRGEALAVPDEFGALVEKYSDDPDKAQTHGLFTVGPDSKPDKVVQNGINALRKVGEISDPLIANGGYQILKLVKATNSVVPPYAEVHDRIVGELRDNYTDAQRRNFVDHLSSEKLDANPAAVASLRVRYLTVPAASPGAGPREAIPERQAKVNPAESAARH